MVKIKGLSKTAYMKIVKNCTFLDIDDPANATL